jgi:hypothetical protein
MEQICFEGAQPCALGYHGGLMSIAPLPTPLQHLGGRRFSFCPPIRSLEPNEWLYRGATWSECVVANARSGEEVCVPRMFLGDVSHADEPVMIVGLNRELEWRSGSIVPLERRVIEMPVAVNDARPAPARSAHLAPVINIRLEPPTEVRFGKRMGVALLLGAVGLTIVAGIARQVQGPQRGDVFRPYRAYLQLKPGDDYASIARKLGTPAFDRSRDADGRVFRALVYRSFGYGPRTFSIILVGSTAAEGRYIGTVDNRGRLMDAVRFPDGSTSEWMLRSLPKF